MFHQYTPMQQYMNECYQNQRAVIQRNQFEELQRAKQNAELAALHSQQVAQLGASGQGTMAGYNNRTGGMWSQI